MPAHGHRIDGQQAHPRISASDQRQMPTPIVLRVNKASITGVGRTSATVKGLDDGRSRAAPSAPEPSSESLQGRNPRDVGDGHCQAHYGDFDAPQ
jgi:hypothetical protein